MAYNIVLLNHHASCPDTGGGGRHYELGKSLSGQGYDVTIVASSYNHGKKICNYSEDMTTRRYNNKFRAVYIKTSPNYKGTVGRFLNYRDYMKKAGSLNGFENKPDVIIASSVHPLAWVAGYKISKRYNAKFIVEVRDLWPLSMYEDFSGLTKKAVFSYFESLERKYYKLADSIITTAPFAYEYIEEKYGIDRNKVFYIPHGLDIDSFDEDGNLDDKILDDKLRETLKESFCVTYTGSLSKSEGLTTLVESAKYLSDIKKLKIVIVGSGNEKETLKEIIMKENLANVVMIDKQPRNTMALTLKKSDILFCGLMERQAFKYGISKNKFYDYMASEKPIIFASSVRGSLIDKAKAGITIKPNDPKNLASKIKYLYENIDSLGKKYAKNGRDYVERYHTNETIAEQFINVINKDQKGVKRI